MGILEGFLFLALRVVCAGIDVVAFLLLARVFAKRWQVWWLVEFDAIGRRLIDGLLTRIGNAWYGAFHTRLTEGGELITAAVLCSVVELLIQGTALLL
jgi:hypothetical protein